MSKRHRPRPLNLDDSADRERSHIARSALLTLLQKDLRVQQALEEWARTPEAARCVATIVLANDDMIARLAWERERPALARRMVADLPCSADWLPRWLADAGLLTALGTVWKRRVNFVFTEGQDPSIQRRAKGKGRTIARDVGWLYRARIKNPPDSISQLAREYGASAQRHTGARSVVQDGISRAAALLELHVYAKKSN